MENDDDDEVGALSALTEVSPVNEAGHEKTQGKTTISPGSLIWNCSTRILRLLRNLIHLASVLLKNSSTAPYD